VSEPQAVIEPEAAPPAPHPRRRRRAVVAGVTLLAVVAGGIAVAADGGRSEPKPLALMAGNGVGGGAETMAARSASPAPVIPGQAAADSRSAMYPYGGWGLKFEVEGQLPDLPDHAAAWRVAGPNLDRAAIVRIADALAVNGTPAQRDGGWSVDAGDWMLSAFGGDASGKGGPWSINLYRNRYDVAGDNAPVGPAISRADAERRVLDLLDRMGAPRASWTVETTDTEIGTGWACAAPAPGLSPEELKRLEAEKLRQVEQENAAANPAPSADGGVASCPPPPPPVKGFHVALYPMLDGRRADWPVWNVTMRSDGRIDNLSGSWVTFERAGDYKLRGVDAALKDLQSPPVAYATDTPAAAIEPAPAVAAGSVEGSGAAGSAPGRLPMRDDVASSPAIDLPAEAPVCPPVPMPLPAQDGKATSSMAPSCAPPAPQVVKITGVELGLMQTSVFESGQVRLALVPSYRFVGHFADSGSPWETSAIALHPDAIAPPPDFPVVDDVRSGGGATGVGKAVPPTPPAAEPAVVRE
jgi:hypothetical protein